MTLYIKTVSTSWICSNKSLLSKIQLARHCELEYKSTELQEKYLVCGV